MEHLNLTLSVIVVTLNRPECALRCVEALKTQQPHALDIVVVDASADDRTELLVSRFPEVTYLRTQAGYGHMTASRNLGLLHVRGDIVAFLDDDAYAHPDWSAQIIQPFTDSIIGGVGGRALNNQPGEESIGIDEIGTFTPSGHITGNFAANPGRIVATDHIIGCNMAWRRSVLAQLGGLREEFPGTEVREETDIALRVRRIGYQIVFNPAAVVDHLGAPQARGRRFDVRYAYFAQRNHITLLLRNYGLGAAVAWRYVATSSWQAGLDFLRRLAAAFLRLLAFIGGSVIGLAAGSFAVLARGTSPERTDKFGEMMRAKLGVVAPSFERKENNLSSDV